jgi:hypothetical protein
MSRMAGKPPPRTPKPPAGGSREKAAPRRAAASKAAPAGQLPKGIKIKLAGKRTTRQLRAMLHDAVNELEAAGIEHVSGINLYVTPTDKSGQPLIMRTRIPDLLIDAPYPVAADEYGA